MKREVDITFALLKSAIFGGAAEVPPLDASHWWSLFRLLQRNHVAALCFDMVSKASAPRDVLMPWLSEHEKAVEWHRYQQQVQQEIIDRMQQQGIETLVLKGTHTAQYYPRPEEREFGDLDLYFYDRHADADRVAREVLRASVSNDAHHHSKYNYRGVTVESHYDFVNCHYPPSNRRYETLLKEQAPNATFEVLFLLRHMAGHFAASRITLRDLVDWTLTCHALADKVDWETVQNAIEEYGMLEFAASLNSIASRRFGIQPPCNLTGNTASLSLVEHDIVYGTMDDHSGNGIGRLGWKLRRWRALGWKRKMVYNDNSLRLMLSSLTSHTMKPQSILHKQ